MAWLSSTSAILVGKTNVKQTLTITQPDGEITSIEIDNTYEHYEWRGLTLSAANAQFATLKADDDYRNVKSEHIGGGGWTVSADKLLP